MTNRHKSSSIVEWEVWNIPVHAVGWDTGAFVVFKVGFVIAFASSYVTKYANVAFEKAFTDIDLSGEESLCDGNLVVGDRILCTSAGYLVADGRQPAAGRRTKDRPLEGGDGVSVVIEEI
jgi:hypothetical protein